MRFPRFLSGGGPNAAATDLGLLLLRLFAGLALAFGHGLGKLPPSPGFVEGVAGMGFPLPGLFAWAAAIAEFAGGLLLAVGLMTRPASLFILLTMATAGFIRHAPDPFSGKEKAFLFLFVALLFLIVGAGRYSIDAFFDRRREESRRQGAGGKQTMIVLIAALLITPMSGSVALAQEMDLESYEPKSTLVVPPQLSGIS